MNLIKRAAICLLVVALFWAIYLIRNPEDVPVFLSSVTGSSASDNHKDIHFVVNAAFRKMKEDFSNLKDLKKAFLYLQTVLPKLEKTIDPFLQEIGIESDGNLQSVLQPLVRSLFPGAYYLKLLEGMVLDPPSS